MAIILAYERVSKRQVQELSERLREFGGLAREKEQFYINSSSIVLSPTSAAITFNDGLDIQVVQAQRVLDTLIEVLKPRSWGTDFPRAEEERRKPPAVYVPKYKFSIPYDSRIGNGIEFKKDQSELG